MEKKEWGNVEKKLSKGYEWGVQFAGKKEKRGRAMEGMLMGIRKEIIDKEFEIEKKQEGIMIERIKKGEEKWRIIGVYVREKIEETLRRIEQWVEREEIKTLVGGGF